MSVINHTPFSAIAFRQYNLAGKMMGVVSVRGTFFLTNNGPLAVARNQASLALADVYDGDDPYQSQLVTQGDLVPFKRGTDITFSGAAHTDDGSPQTSWTCRLSVGRVSKTLRVHGPRKWLAIRRKGFIRRTSLQWQLGHATPVSSVNLHWSKAYGGTIPSGDSSPAQSYEANPLGCGIVSDALNVDEVPAPQLEDTDDPITDWRKAYIPQNLGPIPRFGRSGCNMRAPMTTRGSRTATPFCRRILIFDFGNALIPT